MKKLFTIILLTITAGFLQAQTPAPKTALEIELQQQVDLLLTRGSVATNGATTSIEGESLGVFELQVKNTMVFGRESEGPLQVLVDKGTLDENGNLVTISANDVADFEQLKAAGVIRLKKAKDVAVGEFVLTKLKTKSGRYVPGWIVPAGTAPAPATDPAPEAPAPVPAPAPAP